MKMRTLTKILALLTLMISLFVGYSTFVVDHVETLTPTEAVTPVCYIKSSGKKYTRIEKAVQVANNSASNETIVVMDGVNPVIESSFTINSNVTLLISYSGETLSNKAANIKNTETDLSKQVLKKTVILSNKATITNNGTIEIGGVLSGGSGNQPFAGHTGVDYAQILMTPGTKITNSGSIFCFGYIRDGDYNKETKEFTYKYYETGGGQIENTGGHFYIPFILRDYRGGSSMVSIGNSIDTYHVSAFNQIDFRNVTCSISFDYYSHMIAYANLYTGQAAGGVIKAQMNSTDIAFIGLADSLGSYLIEPTNENFKLVAHTNINDEVTKIDIYGGAKTNAMKLSISIAGIDKTVSTENVFFPLSFRLKVTLHKTDNQTSASFTIAQKYKIMAGSSLTIDKGASLTANEIIVYGKDDFIDGSSSSQNIGGTKYPRSNPVTGKALEEGNLIVNGTLNVSTLGGYVYTQTNKALLNITSSASSTSNEAKTQDTSSRLPTGYKLSDVYTISKTVSFMTLNNYSQSTFVQLDNVPVGSYPSCERNSSYGFISDQTIFNINYVDDFDNVTSHGITVNNNVTQITKNTVVNLETPTNDDLVFAGFYMLSGSTRINISKLSVMDMIQYVNSDGTFTVYMEWEENTKTPTTIQFKNYDSSGNLINTTESYTSYAGKEFTINSTSDNTSRPIQVNTGHRLIFTFSHWLVQDSSGTTILNSNINGNTFTVPETADNVIYVIPEYSSTKELLISLTNKSYWWKNVITSAKLNNTIDLLTNTNNQYCGINDSIYVQISSSKNMKCSIKIGNSTIIELNQTTSQIANFSLSTYKDIFDNSTGPLIIEAIT
ncbi:MAG: hypothetical protein MR345_02060 [Bacilli bacterium]|nr:hypothetical protein [Bacilli bacterium]